MGRRMLVATDGREDAAGALRLALALTREGMEPPLVLAVHEPIPVYGLVGPGAMPGVRAEMERVGMEPLRDAVRAQIGTLGPDAVEWEVRFEVGAPASVVADVAAEHGASLILVGRGRHAPLDRWLVGETALGIVQLAHTPVLAVQPDARALPRRALVAVDFSDMSRAAARRALELLRPDGELHLVNVVHVPSVGAGEFTSDDWLPTYLKEAAGELEEERREMGDGGGRTIHTHVLQGEPTAELLKLASTLDAELIAAGRHGRGFLGRLLIGSVSTRLFRRAPCSILVVPPTPAGSS